MNYGIVLVSHVYEIPEGIKQLLSEVAPDVSVTTAGGTEEKGIGTNYEKISKAIEENNADHILAFYDLGSAKMNLELALELVEKSVTIYDTAFLEGVYTTAALLQAGAALEDIEAQLNPLIIK